MASAGQLAPAQKHFAEICAAPSSSELGLRGCGALFIQKGETVKIDPRTGGYMGLCAS